MTVVNEGALVGPAEFGPAGESVPVIDAPSYDMATRAVLANAPAGAHP